ncbi:MAG: hypothetical protein KGJ05_02205, partial [Alphaproteobacteria bacterium]|nr:hypothetical protein [Alphaproteobacteria bacterium]
EQIMLAFAARRAIDRGVALGYLEGLLNQRFAATQPRAVANIIAASHTPVTLDELYGQLDAVAVETGSSASQGNWWRGVQRDLGALFTIRRADQVEPRRQDRIAQARLALRSGAVDRAAAEIARLPATRSGNVWLASARRYIDAHTALDVIEAAVLTQETVAPPQTVKATVPPAGMSKR